MDTYDTSIMAEWRIKALENDSLPGTLWRGEDDGIPFIVAGAMLAEHDAACMQEERPADCMSCYQSLPADAPEPYDEWAFRAYVADALADGGIDHD